jgi:hypothetical protein
MGKKGKKSSKKRKLGMLDGKEVAVINHSGNNYVTNGCILNGTIPNGVSGRNTHLSHMQLAHLIAQVLPTMSTRGQFIEHFVAVKNQASKSGGKLLNTSMEPIRESLARVGFSLTKDAVRHQSIVKPKPCTAFAMEVVIAHKSARGKSKRKDNRRECPGQHVIVPPLQCLGEDELKTVILYIPAADVFLSRFSSNPSVNHLHQYCPLPAEWLRLKSNGGVADGSFVKVIKKVYAISPKVPLRSNITYGGCYHMPDQHPGTPFVTPTAYIPPEGKTEKDYSIEYTTGTKAERRNEYRDRLVASPSNRSRCRRQVNGAYFASPALLDFELSSAHVCCPLIINCLDGEETCLHILEQRLGDPNPGTLVCGSRSFIRVNRRAPTDFLTAGQKLGAHIRDNVSKGSGSVRKGDLATGHMHAFGQHTVWGINAKKNRKIADFADNAKLGDTEHFRSFAEEYSRYVEDQFPFESAAMLGAERSQGVIPRSPMLSDLSNTCSMNVSINLANSDHLDIRDASVGVSMFLEDKPGLAKDWFFVLPNILLYHDGKRYEGVLVRLTHGTAVSWDGRIIRHCTARCEGGGGTVVGNNVYGMHIAANGPMINESRKRRGSKIGKTYDE